MRGARHNGQLRPGKGIAHCVQMGETDEVIVCALHQCGSWDLNQVVELEGGVEQSTTELGEHYGEMVSLGLDQRWRKVLDGHLAAHRLGNWGAAADIDRRADDDQLSYQVWTTQGDNHCHVAAITPTNEVDVSNADCVNECMVSSAMIS